MDVSKRDEAGGSAGSAPGGRKRGREGGGTGERR